MEWIATNTNKKLTEIQFHVAFIKEGKRTQIVSDEIFSFDIETTSGFLRDGETEIKPFDFSKDPDYYEDCEKFCIPYIWQFSINEHVFVGRTFDELRDLFSQLNSFEPNKKYIYVHNLSFEFQCFLRDFYNDSFDEVFARKARKVLYCTVGSFCYRCSYFLTNFSLEQWAIQKQLPVKKLTGNLDYNVIRTPKTELTREELDYCIYDCLVVYEGIKQYKKQYGTIHNIPLTQTGEVRRELQKRMSVKTEEKYRKKCISLIPPTLEDYSLLTRIFQGGYTHANYRYANRAVKGIIYGKDLASSYPTVMTLEKFPFTPFVKTKFNERYMNENRYSFIIEFSVKNVKSKLYNSFWSISSTKKLSRNYKADNGRIRQAEEMVVEMTNVDYSVFIQAYDFTDFQVLNFYVSCNEYLSNTFVKYVLELYGNKTQLKGIEEFADLYMKSKQYVNSLYGCFVTKEIDDEIIFLLGEWKKNKLDEKTFYEKTAKLKKKIAKTFGAYQLGVWVTAYARRNLWRGILSLDKDLLYCDTDSLYYVGKHEEFFEEYNAEIERRENERAKMLNVSRETFSPKDKKGKPHRLGVWDSEHTDTENVLTEFKTLGAKKYIYRQDGILKMTVSGVRKKAVEQIGNIDEFNDGLVFDYEHAKKNIPHYIEEQREIVWNRGKYDEWKSTNKYGICIQPTTYSLGITDEYLALILTSNFFETSELLENEVEFI